MRLSSFLHITHTHSLGRMSERGEAGIRERDYCYQNIIFMFLSFTFGANSISEEVVGFSPLWFPRGKSLCLLSLMFFVVLVIVSVKYPKIILSK